MKGKFILRNFFSTNQNINLKNSQIFVNNNIVSAFQNIYVECFAKLTNKLANNLFKNEPKFLENNYKFILDFNDEGIYNEIFTEKSNLNQLCFNANSKNLIKGVMCDLPLYLPLEVLLETEEYKNLVEIFTKIKNMNSNLLPLEKACLICGISKTFKNHGKEDDIEHISKNVNVLNHLIKTTFNYAFIYFDKYHASLNTIEKHDKIISKMEKSSTGFDLNLFNHFYDKTKPNKGYNDFLNYIYEKGDYMKILSLRDYSDQNIETNKQIENCNKLGTGLLEFKNVLDVIKLNNFKGMIIFNDEEIEQLNENFNYIDDILCKNKFINKNKLEILEQIKSSEKIENDIGLFL